MLPLSVLNESGFELIHLVHAHLDEAVHGIRQHRAAHVVQYDIAVGRGRVDFAMHSRHRQIAMRRVHFQRRIGRQLTNSRSG